MQNFDLIVIGAGPAGYTAAIRASQLGMKVACVEKRPTLGGTCLNVGCIPSKALLYASEMYEKSLKDFSHLGIVSNAQLDLNKMLANKDKIVSDLCKGIGSLFVKNKIKLFTGNAKILDTNTVSIVSAANDASTTLVEKISAKNILICTGSQSITMPRVDVDEEKIVSSTGALSLNSVPKKMIVIGGGYIGLEIGSVWRRLGTQVTVIEYSDKIVPALDFEIGAMFFKLLQKQGMEFHLSTKVISATKREKDVRLNVKDEKSGKEFTMDADVVLVAIGRKPYTTGLGIEDVGIKCDKHSKIEIDRYFRTSVPNIYAVGDVVTGPMLAHKAEEEAVAAVEIMANQAGHVDYNLIPSVVYTDPEVAAVGFTEEQLKDKNINYKVGKFPFLANSRARVIGSTDGMVKILADAKTDAVLGAHIIGYDAGNLIAEIAAYMTFGASSEDIARTCHAHPTLNEAIKEAALSVDKRSINF